MGEHSKLSPSSAERWLQCPGSVRLVDLLGPGGAHTGSKYAHEGTLAHVVCEIEAAYHFGQISKGKYKARLLHWRDITPIEYQSEMLRHAGTYVALLQSFMDEHEGHDCEIQLEKRVDPAIPGSWGTADAIIICRTCNHIHVIDFKYGMGVAVFAEDNPQIKIYGLGALEEFGDDDTTNVCMTIHQPRMGSVSHCCEDAMELRLWRDLVALPQAKLALGPDGYLAPSESACRWCPVAGQCTARTKYMTAVDFGSPDLMSPDDIAEIMERMDDIEDWCKQIRETALRKAYYDGTEIPGWKVVRSNGRRRIENHAATIELFLKEGFDFDEVARTSTKTLGDLESLVGGKAALAKMLGDLIILPPGKESLVRADDDRPAISSLTEAEKDFA